MRAQDVLEDLDVKTPWNLQGRWEDYEGPMGAVIKNSQIAERIYRVGEELVRITVTVANVPPYQETKQLEIEVTE